MSKECFLRSLDGSHPDLLLEDGVQLEVGRGPKTKIKESRCSRVQVVLTADYVSSSVLCTQHGGNPSCAQGTLLKPGSKYTLHHKDLLELLQGQFKYSIVFNPPPAPGEYETVSKPGKRNLSEDSSPGSQSESKKSKTIVSFGSNPSWFSPEQGHVFSTKNGFEWMKAYNEKMISMRTTECKDQEKIAAFDLDGTIITTQSGKVFATDKNDWKILYPEIPGKLKSLHKESYKIVFITNQAGISRGKLKEEDFQEKVERIQSKLGVPLQVICSTSGGGFFRKPRPGTWFWLEQVGNNKVEVNREESFYCGDAAGREQNWSGKRKKDFSCSDRLFALNLGLKFYTPEEYFQGQAPTKKFALPGFDPRTQTVHSLLEPETEELVSKSQELILMVGIQGSGKSHVSNLLESKGYLVASNDKSGGKEKTLRIVRDGFNSGKRIVVDNTHRDKESRKDYINLARNARVPIRCFVMKTSHDHARHNNAYRELVDSEHTKINEMLFNSYRVWSLFLMIRVWSLLNHKLRKLKPAEALKDINREAEDVLHRMLDDSTAESSKELIGHSGPVLGVSFSPDKTLLLSGSEDGVVRLWSLQTWTCLVCYKGHIFPVWDVQFSPLGYYFASCGHDRTARLWTTEQAHPLRIFQGHFSDVDCLAFHPNSNYIGTGSSDRSLRMWDCVTGSCVRFMTGHKSAVLCLAFSPDGRFLASGSSDLRVLIWDCAFGHLLAELGHHTQLISGLAFSREGTILSSSAIDSTIALWDFAKLMNESSLEEVNVTHNPDVRRDTENLLLGSYRTKSTPVLHLHYTRRNLLLAVGPLDAS